MGDEQYAETNFSFNPLIATVAGHLQSGPIHLNRSHLAVPAKCCRGYNSCHSAKHRRPWNVYTPNLSIQRDESSGLWQVGKDDLESFKTVFIFTRTFLFLWPMSSILHYQHTSPKGGGAVSPGYILWPVKIKTFTCFVQIYGTRILLYTVP